MKLFLLLSLMYSTSVFADRREMVLKEFNLEPCVQFTAFKPEMIEQRLSEDKSSYVYYLDLTYNLRQPYVVIVIDGAGKNVFEKKYETAKFQTVHFEVRAPEYGKEDLERKVTNYLAMQEIRKCK